jgi:hypothetical protein
MVDYSAALPQQQNFQAPDLMQNAMRMQQMQVQNAQMQELARKRQEETALRGITADPNSPEYVQQLARISPELGMRALNMQRQNTLLEQQTRAAGLSATKTGQDIQSGHIDLIRKFNDEIPGILASNNPAAAYANWRARLKSLAPESNVPETFPGAKALSGYADKAEAFLTRNKPQLTEVGGAKVEYTPNGGLRELNVTPSMAGSADANVGPATAAMNPDRLAAMQATQARLGLPVMQPSAAGANAAVNNMPGVPVAPAVAAPVNNMPGAAPIQPPVGNAMAASPSPYGAPIGAGAFAQQQKAQEDQRVLALELAKKRGEAQVAQEQALPKAKSEDIAKREVGFEKATTNVRTAAQELDEQIRLVNELRTHPGLTNITGTLYGRTPNLSQSAVNAQSLLDTVKEKGKLTALLNLKEAGGTLGQVSNAEGEGLRQSIAPLAQRQDTETFQRRLNDYAAKLTAAKAKLTGAYEDTYAYKGAKAPASSFTVADPTGKVHTFLSQQAADQFKQAAGL